VAARRAARSIGFGGWYMTISAAQSGMASRIAQSKNFAACGTSGLFIRAGPVICAAPCVNASFGR